MSRDPLAGFREEINNGTIETLHWPDEGKGCPVKVGDFFELRSCGIEITSVRRVKRGGRFYWRATFSRIRRATKPYLLANSGTRDYTRDARGAMASGEPRPDWAVLPTDQVPVGPPPEPEAIPPDEVRDLPSSVAARARYEELKREEAAAHRELPLAVRLARLRRMARDRHVDISGEERVIERRIEAIERKLGLGGEGR